MDKNLYFHIGCTYAKEPILRGLLKENLHLIILDDIGIKSSEIDIPYYSIFAKTYKDVHNLICEIAKEKEIDTINCYFFTLAEGSVDLLNQLLKDFGKSPISQRSDTLKNKHWVRKKFDEHNIERLPYLAFAKDSSEIPKPTDNFFPLIVKPIGSMASRNVFKVSDYDELKKACLEIFTKNKTFITADHGEIVIEDVYGQPAIALIESCLTGEKLSFEVLIIHGKIQFFAVTSKFDYDNSFFYERADIVDPNYFNEDQINNLNIYLKRIVEALQIESTILHVEVFFDRKNSFFHLIEVNFRMGGDEIHELVTRAYGVDIVAEFLKISSNLVPNKSLMPTKLPEKVWTAFYFMTDHGGEFKAVSHNVFNNEIAWDFVDGDKISKFSTSKFYKLGTVVFPSEKKQITKRLEYLFKESELYFTVKQE